MDKNRPPTARARPQLANFSFFSKAKAFKNRDHGRRGKNLSLHWSLLRKHSGFCKIDILTIDADSAL
jgi:hypothetical protein